MNILDLVINVAILFVMMIPGIILKKCRLASDGLGKGISNLVLYIAQPALILYAYLSFEGKFADIWLDGVLVLAFSVIAHCIFSGVALLTFRRAPDSAKRMLRFATVFSNAAFMGIPLIQAIFNTRPEVTIYASIYNITFNMFLWTLGVYFCTSGRDRDNNGSDDWTDEKKKRRKSVLSFVKVLVHPVTLASVIGIVLLATGVNNATLASIKLDIISTCLEMLKNLVAPLSMTVLGLRIAEVKWRGMLRDKYMYLFLALRHILLPLAVVAVMKLCAVIGVPISYDVLTVTVILAAAPAASSATMFAEKYDCDASYVSRIVAISTVLCIGTMPLIVMLANLWFGF